MNKKLIEEVREDVREIKKILVGNGKIGLCEEVRNNKEHINLIKRVLIGLVIVVIIIMASTGMTFKEILSITTLIKGL